MPISQIVSGKFFEPLTVAFVLYRGTGHLSSLPAGIWSALCTWTCEVTHILNLASALSSCRLSGSLCLKFHLTHLAFGGMQKKKKKKNWTTFCVWYKTRLKKKGPDSIPALKSLRSPLDNEAFIGKETWMMQAVPLLSGSLPPSVFLILASVTVCAISLIVLYLFTLNRSFNPPLSLLTSLSRCIL